MNIKYYMMKSGGLSRAMSRKGISLRGLEAMTQIPKSRLGRLCSGETVSCDFPTIAVMSAALDVSMDEIADLEKEFVRPIGKRWSNGSTF